MCLPAVTAATLPAYTLAVAAVGTAASIGMGIASARQQAAQAQVQLDFQAKQALNQQRLAEQQAELQQRQQYDALLLQQKQSTQAYNLQVQQSNTQIANQYEQQLQAVRNERTAILARNTAERNEFQKSKETAIAQNKLNNEAANRAYIGQQNKLEEGRKKAAFAQQALLAKAIGSKGSILASGRTGQSVGLLVRDVERQQGLATAQDLASIDSARNAAIVAMEGDYLKAQSANNVAKSQVGYDPGTPLLPDLPQRPKFIEGIGLQINDNFSYA